jgi:hypothetical protein
MKINEKKLENSQNIWQLNSNMPWIYSDESLPSTLKIKNNFDRINLQEKLSNKFIEISSRKDNFLFSHKLDKYSRNTKINQYFSFLTSNFSIGKNFHFEGTVDKFYINLADGLDNIKVLGEYKKYFLLNVSTKDNTSFSSYCLIITISFYSFDEEIKISTNLHKLREYNLFTFITFTTFTVSITSLLINKFPFLYAQELLYGSISTIFGTFIYNFFINKTTLVNKLFKLLCNGAYRPHLLFYRCFVNYYQKQLKNYYCSKVS